MKLKNIRDLVDYYGYRGNRYDTFRNNDRMYSLFKKAIQGGLVGISFLKENKDFISISWLPIELLIVIEDGFLEVYPYEYLISKGRTIAPISVLRNLVDNFTEDRFLRCYKLLYEQDVVDIVLSFDFTDSTYKLLRDEFENNSKIIQAINYIQNK